MLIKLSGIKGIIRLFRPLTMQKLSDLTSVDGPAENGSYYAIWELAFRILENEPDLHLLFRANYERRGGSKKKKSARIAYDTLSLRCEEKRWDALKKQTGVKKRIFNVKQ